MSGRKSREQLERRLDDVRRSLRDRHAEIEPDAFFADRIVARLPRPEGWTIAWAARRILPVSVALAMVLMVAALATSRSTHRTIASSATSATESAHGGNDALEWLLEGGEERR